MGPVYLTLSSLYQPQTRIGSMFCSQPLTWQRGWGSVLFRRILRAVHRIFPGADLACIPEVLRGAVPPPVVPFNHRRSKRHFHLCSMVSNVRQAPLEKSPGKRVWFPLQVSPGREKGNSSQNGKGVGKVL